MSTSCPLTWWMLRTDLLVCWCECVVKWLFERARRSGVSQWHFSLKFSHASCDRSLIPSLSAWVEKKTCSFCPVVCRLPREHSTCEQCVPGSLSSSRAQEPGNEDMWSPDLQYDMLLWRCSERSLYDFNNRWGAHITWALPEESTIFYADSWL